MIEQIDEDDVGTHKPTISEVISDGTCVIPYTTDATNIKHFP